MVNLFFQNVAKMKICLMTLEIAKEGSKCCQILDKEVSNVAKVANFVNSGHTAWVLSLLNKLNPFSL